MQCPTSYFQIQFFNTVLNLLLYNVLTVLKLSASLLYLASLSYLFPNDRDEMA